MAQLAIAREKYRDVEYLARGSFGRAFKAERIKEGDIVVVKEINLNDICGKKSNKEQRCEYRDMAYREFDVMAKLVHPNIVGALELYSSGDFIHIVMEYCDSESMADAIDERNGKIFPESLVWMWAAQLARALNFLHENKVLHRDVKAENIFITCATFLKLGDFGIAKEIEWTSQSAHTGWGTITHSAPELFDDAGFDNRAEVWSYGVVFHHIATLKLPFHRKSTASLIKSIQNDDPSSKISNRYSKDLHDLASWLLEKDPAKRPLFSQVLEEQKIQAALDEMANQGAGEIAGQEGDYEDGEDSNRSGDDETGSSDDDDTETTDDSTWSSSGTEEEDRSRDVDKKEVNGKKGDKIKAKVQEIFVKKK